jgi:metallo-beta-lactamase family protein
MAKLHFLGAAGTVTGSKYVLETAGPQSRRVMVDCGLFQGLKELRLRNWERLPLDSRSIDAVVLTHAHIDHSGYLPRLVRDGFQGPVYATRASADLLSLMLPDSGRIQEEDADYANRKGFSKHRPALPLYTESDARAALKLLRSAGYGEAVDVCDGVGVRFLPAGHILGSSFVEMTVSEAGLAAFTVLFSGDIGRYDEPILVDPSPVFGADYLLVESTYGNRRHDETDPKGRLAEIINGAVERGGKVIIPAFAIARTQLLVYYLRELEDEGRIPVIPVVIDSPMGAAATRYYAQHRDDHDAEMRRLTLGGKNPLATHNFQLVAGRDGSKALNSMRGPAVIISASGMATGGRVLHHLARCLPDPANAVVLVGYQAEGTRGRRLQEGARAVKIHGEMIPVNARVEAVGSLSAHADSAEILRWLGGFKRPPRLTFVTHGEPDAAAAMRDAVERELGWRAVVPAYHEVVELGGAAPTETD